MTGNDTISLEYITFQEDQETGRYFPLVVSSEQAPRALQSRELPHVLDLDNVVESPPDTVLSLGYCEADGVLSFHQRHLCLRGQFIFFFDDKEGMSSDLNVVPLENCQIEVPPGGRRVFPEHAFTEAKNGYALVIVHESRPPVFVICDCLAQREQWVNALKSRIERLCVPSTLGVEASNPRRQDQRVATPNLRILDCERLQLTVTSKANAANSRNSREESLESPPAPVSFSSKWSAQEESHPPKQRPSLPSLSNRNEDHSDGKDTEKQHSYEPHSLLEESILKGEAWDDDDDDENHEESTEDEMEESARSLSAFPNLRQRPSNGSCCSPPSSPVKRSPSYNFCGEDEDENERKEDSIRILSNSSSKKGHSLKFLLNEHHRSLPPVPSGENELHRFCRLVRSVDDVAKNHDDILTTSNASQRNTSGETPLHIWSMLNSKAVEDLMGMGLDQTPEKAVLDFGLKLFLRYPTAMITIDVDQHIPFERVLQDWVKTQRENRYMPNSSRSVASTVTSVRSSTTHNNNNNKGPPSRRLSNLITVPLSIIALTHSKSRRRSGGLTPSVIFALESLSTILDHLESQQRHGGGFPYEDTTQAPDDTVTADVDLRGPSTVPLHAVSADDIHREICRGLASIPNLVPTILLIPDEEERHFCLSLTVIQRILIHHQTVGPWLTQLLMQESGCAMEYLREVSTALDISTQMSAAIINSQRKESNSPRRSMVRSSSGSGTSNKNNATADHLNHFEMMVRAISKLSDFLPALLSLGDAARIEEAASTPLVGKVLDRLIARPFSVTVIVLDAIFLPVLIVGFRGAVQRLLTRMPEDASILPYIYVCNTGIFHFFVREMVKLVSVWTNGNNMHPADANKSQNKSIVMQKTDELQKKGQETIRRLWSFWNLIDILSIVLALGSSLRMRQEESLYMSETVGRKERTLRALLAITTGFLWLRVLSFLKGLNRQLATFVLAILQITNDVFWFCVILLVMIVSFAQMFYTLMVPKECAQLPLNAEPCRQDEYYLKVYTILLGDYGLYEREEFSTMISVVLAVLFTFIVVVLLLNVLIAVASDSYEKCLLRSQNLFGRARVMMIAELVCYHDLLAARKSSIPAQQPKWPFYPKGLPWPSFVFHLLFAGLVVLWSTGEILGHIRGHGDWTGTTCAILVNFLVFLFLRRLARGSSRSSRGNGQTDDDASLVSEIEKEEDQKHLFSWAQRLVLRFLGTATEHTSSKDELWHGRLDFLQKSIKQTSDEAWAKWEPLLQRLKKQQDQAELEQKLKKAKSNVAFDSDSVEEILISLRQTMSRLEALEKKQQSSKSD